MKYKNKEIREVNKWVTRNGYDGEYDSKEDFYYVGDIEFRTISDAKYYINVKFTAVGKRREKQLESLDILRNNCIKHHKKVLKGFDKQIDSLEKKLRGE